MAKWIRASYDCCTTTYNGEMFATAAHECSNCGSSGWSPHEISSMRFCPNCGERMEQDAEGHAILYEANGITEYSREYHAYKRTYKEDK